MEGLFLFIDKSLSELGKPQRLVGGKGQTTKKKILFFKLEKKYEQKCDH